MNEYDVVILGGGPGGYVCAIRCRQLGLSVALVEKEELGGTCLNWGCIPTKALLRNAEVLESVKEAEVYGINLNAAQIDADYSVAYERSREVSGRLVKGIQTLMRKNSVKVFSDTGFIKDKNTVELEQSGTILKGKTLVLAMGSRPAVLPGITVDGKRILLPKDALGLKKLHQRIAVIGAGPIGMEFASLWQSYGSEVTVFELLDRVLPKEDAEISATVTNRFKKRGIVVRTGTRITQVDVGGPGDNQAITLTYQEKEGASRTMETDAVLMALGVVPVIEGSGMENLGLVSKGKVVQVDDEMRTSVPNVYAIGDMTGLFPLAHVASDQGIIAAESIAGMATESLDYTAVPRCTYCIPEVASIGLTEDEAVSSGKRVASGTFPFYANGKALSLGESDGFVKIVRDELTDEILGVHMSGPHVTEMISGISVALKAESTIEELARAVHPHPTLSEAIKESALPSRGAAIHI